MYEKKSCILAFGIPLQYMENTILSPICTISINQKMFAYFLSPRTTFVNMSIGIYIYTMLESTFWSYAASLELLNPSLAASFFF